MARIRGRIISLQQCFINLGILVAYFIQFGSSHLAGDSAWRLPLGIQMVVRVVTLSTADAANN